MKPLHRAVIILAVCAASLFSMSSAAFASQLVFADEFSGPLNTATWANARTPWNTDYTIGELEHYDPADTTFASGLMTLKSEKRWTSGYSWYMPNGFDYTSGIVTSLNRPKFSYGYFEIRAKLPTGPGIWPAFWLTNDATLEIDGLEMLGDRPSRIYHTLHKNKSMVYSTYHDGPDYSAGFHTYGIDWQPDYVKWYIDGVLTASYVAPVPSDPLYICLNTAVGGAWPGSPTAATTFPQNYDIDYVRVYDTMPPADAVTTTGDSYSTPAGVALNVAAKGVLANDADTLGHTLSATAVTQPAHGTLALQADGSFTYTPASGYYGSDSFTYVASDGLLSAPAATVSITVVAPAPSPSPAPAPAPSPTPSPAPAPSPAPSPSPTPSPAPAPTPPADAVSATGDAYSTPAGVTLSVAPKGVLANDTDLLGHALSASVVTLPAHGTLVLKADGSFTYTPASGYYGSDSFTYVASDGTLIAPAATVSLTVVAPTTVTRPKVRKKASTTYTVSGSVRVSVVSSSVLSTALTGATTTPVVLTVQVQRYRSGRWASYSTKKITNPLSTYKTNVKLRTGKFRVRSLVSGGDAIPAKSAWSSTVKV